MSKQKDRLDLATKYIIDEPDRPTTDLDKAERKTIEQMRLCFDYLNKNPLATLKEQRDFLIKECGISDITAYRYISMAQMLIGEQNVEGKNYAKFKVNALLEEEYTCLKNGDFGGASARHKLIQDYVKVYRLNVDEGETLAIVRQLRESQQEQIVISTDPSVIGIHLTEHEKKEIERLKNMYGYEDSDPIEAIKEELSDEELMDKANRLLEQYYSKEEIEDLTKQ